MIAGFLSWSLQDSSDHDNPPGDGSQPWDASAASVWSWVFKKGGDWKDAERYLKVWGFPVFLHMCSFFNEGNPINVHYFLLACLGRTQSIAWKIIILNPFWWYNSNGWCDSNHQRLHFSRHCSFSESKLHIFSLFSSHDFLFCLKRFRPLILQQIVTTPICGYCSCEKPADLPFRRVCSFTPGTGLLKKLLGADLKIRYGRTQNCEVR